jgi:hypothetical protein
MSRAVPKKPESLDPLATEILDELRNDPEAAQTVVLGGYFALKHYADYRSTADVDAWWGSGASPSEREKTLDRLRSIAHDVARRHGMLVKERISGRSEVVSIEFMREGKAVFSFQIEELTR